MQSLQKPSPPSWQQEILAAYKTGENLLCLFSPDKQSRYCQSLERCLIGKAPSIARVSRTFGSHIAESWLEIQLLDLAEFSGVRKDGVTEKEYEDIARIIISGYGDFKLTEFMVFFQRFKQGLYGTFYGVFDPMVITGSLREFRADREKLLRFYEDKKRQEERKREWERSRTTSLTFEEWEELKWLFNMGYERKDVEQ